MIFAGIGRALGGALDEEEKPRFLEQLESAKQEVTGKSPGGIGNPGDDDDDDEDEEDEEEDEEVVDDGRGR